jgi:hypothetical protein
LLPSRTTSRCLRWTEGDAHRHRQDAQPGLQRAVAAQELEVLRDEEDEAEQREEGDGDGQRGCGEAPVGEQPEVEHRLRRAPLVPHEGGEQQRGEREAAQRAGRRPPVPGGLDDGEHERSERERREHQPRAVDARRRRVLALRAPGRAPGRWPPARSGA